MKKIALLLLGSAAILSTYAQTPEEPKSAKEMLAAIEGSYELDDNKNITYSRVIEAPEMSADQIYERAHNYFVYNYGSGKSVIQTADKEQHILVGKGLFENVHVGSSLIVTEVSAWHIIRVDAKEGRARVIITLTEYEKELINAMDPNAPTNTMRMAISDQYPLNPKGSQKTVMAKALYKTHMEAQKTMDELEKAIKEGNTSSKIENANW